MLISVEIIRNAYRQLRDSGVKIRFITEITNENVQYVKEILDIVSEVRHLDGIKGNLAIGDSRIYAATATMNARHPVEQLVISNVRALVEQQQYFFEMLWHKAMPAELKIREIENGVEPETIETIRDYADIQQLAFDLMKSAKQEILILFATANAFNRQNEAGIFRLLKEIIVARNNSPKIRILSPVDEVIRRSLRELERQLNEELREHKQKTSSLRHKIDFRHIEPSMQTKVSILIVDRRYSLTTELRDDSKTISSESIGLATYSNSKPTVLSYVSIFESLWNQVDLYKQLWDSNKKLEVSIERLQARDEAQNVFINIAAMSFVHLYNRY